MESEKDEEPMSCVICNREAKNKCSVCKSVAYCGKDHQKEDWKSHKTSCKPFEVRKNEELGRYIVSTRDVPAGSLLLTEAPLVVGPRLGGMNPICLGCLKGIAGDASRCPGCFWPACSPVCPGLTSPKQHLPECRILKTNFKLTTRGEFNFEAITPLRCLLQQKICPKKWLDIMSMESHLDKRGEGTDIYREIEEMVVKYLIKNFLSKLDDDLLPNATPEMLHRICGILDVNGLEISNGMDDLIALYPTACLLEHNCIPNTRHTFQMEDFKLKLYSALDIKKDEHVSTMYTHALWGTIAREGHLKETKYFKCKCKRCSDPTELGTNFSTLKCIGENGTLEDACGEDIISQDPLDEDGEWKCKKCPVTLSTDQVVDLTARIGMQVDEVLACPDVESLEKLIKNLEQFLHKNHYHCFMVKHSLIQLYGRDDNYSHEELSDEKLDKKIELIKELLEITDKLDPGNARIILYSSVLLYEYHSALLEKSNRVPGYENKEALWKEAQDKLGKCMAFLGDELPKSSGANLMVLARNAMGKVTKMLDRSCKIVELD